MNRHGFSADSTPAGRDSGRVGSHLKKIRESVDTLQRAELLLLPREARLALDALGSELDGLEEIIYGLEPANSTSPGAKEISPAKASGRPGGKPRILVADDDEDVSELLQVLLGELYCVTVVGSGEDALNQLLGQRFNLAILDVQLPKASGFQLAERLREQPVSIRPAIMYLSAQASRESKIRGLSLGAADYMTKPFDAEELLARVARVIADVAREDGLRQSALTDLMTGLANYRSFIESLEREFARSQRYDQPLCVLTIDLDHLKAINDGAGHEAGNEAIRQVALVLKDGVRSFELVARHGGDEFSVLLPNTSEQEALLISERLRAQVAQRQVQGKPLSISIGLGARARGSDLTLHRLVEESDEALYLAKRTGRNRVASPSRSYFTA